MAIYRGDRPTNNFTILANAALRDDRLSYRARGILAVILSHSPDWRTTSETLAATGKEGRDAVRTALTELEECGYLRRMKRQGQNGRWATAAVVYDVPQDFAEPTTQLSLFQPGTDFQASVNQSSENQAPIEELLQKTSAPTERASAKPKALPNIVADRYWEHAQGIGNYRAVRAVAAQCIKAGYSPDDIVAAMIQAHDAGRPINGAVVGQALQRRQGASMGQVNAKWDAPGASFGKETQP